MREQSRRALRFLGGAVLLALTLYLVKPGAVFDRLQELELRWMALALLVSLPLNFALALRWHHVANRIGAPLSLGRALADYYLASFVNQALPTGLAGAALRALRHAEGLDREGKPIGMGKALSAVIIERLSGLAGLGAFALLGAIALGVREPGAGLVGAASVLAVAIVGISAFVLARRRPTFGAAFAEYCRRALGDSRALLVHLSLSSLAVVLLSATFYCAAHATQVPLSFWDTMLIAPLVLGSMAIPLAIAGWGIREAAAAALFAALGTDAATGVAIAIAFGAITLLASAPGLVVWLSSAVRPGGTEPGPT